MARGPKPVAVVLTQEERERLTRLVRRRGAGQDAVMRARIVLACAGPGATNTAIAERLGVSRQSVITWRQRFLAHRLGGGWWMRLGVGPRGAWVMRPSSN
jgi:hypothetical protein